MNVSFADPVWLVEERRLIARVRDARDKESFAALYRAFAPPLYQQVLLPKLADTHAANDVLAETFQKVLERFYQYESREQSMYFWVKTIAVNLVNDWFRRHARTRRALTSFEDMMRSLPRDAHNDVATGDASRLQQAITTVLVQLHPRYRTAIELRFLKDVARQDCAAQLSVSVATFDVLMLRALRAFHKQWMTSVGDIPHVA
jgi:RNA polymerase sigma factor (sigma-70 family)